jgi:hypothetical protein
LKYHNNLDHKWGFFASGIESFCETHRVVSYGLRFANINSTTVGLRQQVS